MSNEPGPAPEPERQTIDGEGPVDGGVSSQAVPPEGPPPPPQAPATSVPREFLANIITSGGAIICVFFTGVLTARLLSADGRGQVSAVSAWILTLTWASSLGFPRAMAYYEAKGKDRPDVVLGTLLATLVPLGLLGVGVAQVLLPLGFSAQTEETRQVARVFFFAIPFVIATEAFWDVLIGLDRFREVNVARVAQPAIYLVTLLTLWVLDAVTPVTVLSAQCGSFAIIALVLLIRLQRTIGMRRPDGQLARRGLGYGIRLQGVTLGELVTSRLDLMMLPAFVSAAAVGQYSIAVNIASIVMSMFGSLGFVVMPVATKQVEGGDPKVIGQGVRLTLALGILAVIALALLSPLLIRVVYGAEYLHALPSLWWLLPGVVLWSTNSILFAGMQAVGRPGTASLAQLVGVVITLGGLAWSLPRYGIIGAAATSTIAYSSTFLVALLALGRVPSLSLLEIFSLRALRTDARAVLVRVQERLAKQK